MVNNKFYFFTKFLCFRKLDGKFKKIFKLPSKLNSQPILVNEKMIFLILEIKFQL